ncbi:MAG: hypothetical protein OEV64_08455, partial [Desulfobulbaceae bacterium]|nr:hypothetical protein [Desulfobulbaceae bacterium]
MNTPREHATVALDAAEDLTLYADEEFDNDDVDLFEFTTVDDHPLATLKSIILSLEWEIDDNILEQLSEEVRHLLEEWAGDKIVQLYLQGIDKIGRYIRAEQAYAHPNSIKLLNSYFYNLEQILSNPDLTDDDVVLLLKTDVRKFKILQYQISLTRKDAATGPKEEDVTEEVKASSYYEHLRNLKALVLGLDWEITDRDLEEFHAELKELKNIYQTEPYTLVLINGLLTIGAYISEQRIKAHPEAFSLLYAFFESLESFLLNAEIPEEKQKEIIVDRVQRLNNLKRLVAGESGDTAEEPEPEEDIVEEDEIGAEEPVVEPPVAEFEFPEEEISFTADFASEEPEVSETPAAFFDEKVLSEPKHSISKSIPEQGEITFDLSDEIDTHVSSFFDDIDNDESIIYTENELARQAEEKTAKKKKIITDSPISSALSHDPLAEIQSLDDDAIEAIDEEIVDGKRLVPSISDSVSQKQKQPELSLQYGQADEEESGLSLDEVFVPALSDSMESGGFREETYSDKDIEIPQEQIDEKLDSFFGTDSIEESLSAQVSTQTPESDSHEEELIIPALSDSLEERGFDDATLLEEKVEIPQKDIDAKLASFFDIEEDEPSAEKLPLETEEEPLIMALADAEEEHGFREDELSGSQIEISQETIDDKLDSFFGTENEEVPSIQAPTEDLTLETDEEPFMMALADAEEEHGFREDEISGSQIEISQETIDDKLDSFFGTEDEKVPSIQAPTEDLTLETDEEPFMMALADAEEEHGFREDEIPGSQIEISQETIDDKLDSFFGTEDEKVPSIQAPTEDLTLETD